jgi:hypothetical protein
MDIDEFRKRQEADLQRRQHLAQANQTENYYDHDDDDDAMTSGSDADEEIQSPEAVGQQMVSDEGEEA